MTVCLLSLKLHSFVRVLWPYRGVVLAVLICRVDIISRRRKDVSAVIDILTGVGSKHVIKVTG